MLSIFSCASWPSVCLLWKNVYQIFCPFFDWVVCLFLFFFNIELYELFIFLNINPLSVISFASIFSYSIGCLFILLMVSFAVH